MANDKQDKKYALSRSRVGSMSFEEIGKFIGVNYNPDDVMLDPSGMARNSDDGN